MKMSMNPFCEIAVEEALRLKEKNLAKEVVAVSVGPKASAETLRTALAMGADKAIHIETDVRTDQELLPLAVAKLFKFVSDKVSSRSVYVDPSLLSVSKHLRVYVSLVKYGCSFIVRWMLVSSRRSLTSGFLASSPSTGTPIRLVRARLLNATSMVSPAVPMRQGKCWLL